MIWITIGQIVGLALMFEAGRRWGDMRHHVKCHQAPSIPIDWEAAVQALQDWIDKAAESQKMVDGYQVVHSVLDAAFPGMMRPSFSLEQMTPDAAADMLEQLIPDFDRDLFNAEVERFMEMLEEDPDRFLNDQDPGADDAYNGAG